MDEIEFRKSAINAGDCIGTGWKLVTANLGVYLGVALVALIIYIVGSFVASIIPFVGPFITIAVSAPLLGGLYYLAIKNVDGEPIDFAMMFKGFDQLGPLLILALIQALPSIVIIILAYTGEFATMYGLPLPAGSDSSGAGIDPRVLTGLPVLVFLFIGVWVVFSIVWALIFFFSVQLIMDRELGAIEAITTSVRAAFSNAGGAIGLMILCGLVALLGALAICIGLFVAIPVTWVAMAVAYRQVFPRSSETRWTTPPPPTEYASSFGQGL